MDSWLAEITRGLGYLAAADWTACGLILLSYATYFVFKSWRWSVLMHSFVRVGPADLLPVTVTGYAANLLVPHSGEVLRSLQVGRRYDASSTSILASIVLERLLDVCALLFFTLLVLFYDNRGNPWLENTAWVVSMLVFGLLVLAFIALKNSQLFARLMHRALFWLPDSFLDALVFYVTRGIAGFGILENMLSLVMAFLLSLGQWLLILGCVWLSLYAVGIETGPLGVMLIVALMTLGIALPTAPGYVGTTQVCFAVAAGFLDWDMTRTVAASVIYNILMSLPVFGWALWYSAGLPGARGWKLSLRKQVQPDA